MQFDERAERSHHFQASGFFWSDELPHENNVTELQDDYFKLVVFLISYRAQLVLENMTPEIDRCTPVWAAFRSKCGNWPGFHENRCSAALAGDLRAADEELAKELDRLFKP